MNLNKEFRTLIVPVIKGSPIMVIILVIAIVVARRIVNYSVPVYQTDAALKIDNRDYGVGNFFLFNEEGGPKPSLASAFLTEVELLKTRKIKEETFKKLDFFVTYYRVGKITTREIYTDSPFKLTFEVFQKSAYNKPFSLEYIGNEKFAINKTETEKGSVIKFDQPFLDENFKITLHKNDEFWLKENPPIKNGDIFDFELHDLETLVKSINSTNLFIKPVDKEITIIKVYFKHEIPEKAAKFCNTFIETYIEQAKNLNDSHTNKSIEFIDKEIERISKKLKNAEEELTFYKQSEKLVNMNQETDAILKELTALDLRLVDFELETLELNNLYSFLLSKNDISAFSPNFKTINDKVFEDGFLKLKGFELERNDLLQRYTPTSSEVQNVQTKITTFRSFLVESIEKKLQNIESQKKEIQTNIDKVNTRLKLYPDKQRKIAGLERDVTLAAQTYKYLTEKRTELGIALSSNLVFHRVIESAQVPKSPSSPNIPLIYGLFIFIALLVSLFIIYVRHYFINKIESKEELKDYSQQPILSTISAINEKHINEIEPYLNLYTNINILQKEKFSGKEIKPWTIFVSSIMPNEGRSFVVAGLGRTMAHFDKKVLLIDLDNRKPKLHNNFNLKNTKGVTDVIRDTISIEDAIVSTGYENLDILMGGNLKEIPEELVFSPTVAQVILEMKKYYDIIIIDSPPTAVHIESVALMHEADINLFMVQAHKSRARFVKHIETFLEEYKVPNFYLVLNGIHQARGFYAKSYRLGFRTWLIKKLSGRRV